MEYFNVEDKTNRLTATNDLFADLGVKQVLKERFAKLEEEVRAISTRWFSCLAGLSDSFDKNYRIINEQKNHEFIIFNLRFLQRTVLRL